MGIDDPKCVVIKPGEAMERYFDNLKHLDLQKIFIHEIDSHANLTQKSFVLFFNVCFQKCWFWFCKKTKQNFREKDKIKRFISMFCFVF